MGRALIGALLGAIILFVWGYVFWGVLPVGQYVMLRVPNESVVAQALKENLASSGMYYFPMPESHAQMDPAFVEKHKAGPLVQIFYRREGSDPSDPMYFVRGFGYLLVCALLMGILMRQAGEGLESYLSRVTFVVVAGLFGTAIAFSGAVWWSQSLNYHLLNVVFNVSSWLFAGLAMAAVIKPSS